VVRVAVVQQPPAYLDLDGSIERAVGYIAEAADCGAQLVAFGETWLPGYPAWIFGTAGWDDPAAKRLHARLMRNAVSIPGEAVERLAAAARKHAVHVVMGCHERDARFSRGTLFNSILFFDDQGDLLGVHRKLWPTHAERLVWGLGDGSTLRSYDTKVGRIGGLVCWEHWMPLARFVLHASGEQIHVALWPETVEMHHVASRHYAFEGRCFVVCAGSYLRLADIPSDFEPMSAFGDLGDLGGSGGELIPGGSGIIGPDGHWVAGPVAHEATIVYGDIDLGRVEEEQMAFDAAGHYGRPDVFQLTVDSRRQEPLRFVEAGEGATSPQLSLGIREEAS
jgi:nitrilase